MQHHVQTGTANDVDAILGQEMEAGLVFSGHTLLPSPLCHEEPIVTPLWPPLTAATRGGVERFRGIAFNRLTQLKINLIGNGHDSD